jgi:hypothetical protein
MSSAHACPGSLVRSASSPARDNVCRKRLSCSGTRQGPRGRLERLGLPGRLDHRAPWDYPAQQDLPGQPGLKDKRAQRGRLGLLASPALLEQPARPVLQDPPATPGRLVRQARLAPREIGDSLDLPDLPEQLARPVLQAVRAPLVLKVRRVQPARLARPGILQDQPDKQGRLAPRDRSPPEQLYRRNLLEAMSVLEARSRQELPEVLK